MNRLSPMLFLISLITLSDLPTPAAYAQPVEGGPAVPGLVVLQNGNVVRGNIQSLRDHYRIELPGGQLRIRTEQVEMFCKDLDEAYRERRANRTASSADSHLELARWCMRYDLHAHAARELEEARTIDAEHSRLPLLERQLKQLVKIYARSEPVPARVTLSAEELVEQQQLDEEALAKAPKWARVLFVRQVQPLLVHSCATAGCHQPGSSTEDFQLDRLAIDAAGHPDVTQRNLAATLTQIDWDSPGQSQLLQRAITAHGESGARQLETISPHKIKLLQMWVEQLAAVNQASAATKMIAAKPIPFTPTAPTTSGNSTISPADQTPEKVMLTGFVERDPFDAGFFNSRYGGQQVADRAVGASSAAEGLDFLTPPFAAAPALPQ